MRLASREVSAQSVRAVSANVPSVNKWVQPSVAEKKQLKLERLATWMSGVSPDKHVDFATTSNGGTNVADMKRIRRFRRLRRNYRFWANRALPLEVVEKIMVMEDKGRELTAQKKGKSMEKCRVVNDRIKKKLSSGVNSYYMRVPSFIFKGEIHADPGMPPPPIAEEGEEEGVPNKTETGGRILALEETGTGYGRDDENTLGDWVAKSRNLELKMQKKAVFQRKLPHWMSWIFMAFLIAFIGVTSWLTLVYTMKFDLAKRELAEQSMLFANTTEVYINGTRYMEMTLAYALEYKLAPSLNADDYVDLNSTVRVVMNEYDFADTTSDNSTFAMVSGSDMALWATTNVLGITQNMFINQPATLFGKATVQSIAKALWLRRLGQVV
jgi:hypothetical protein